MAVGGISRPVSQTSFKETMNEHFNKIDKIKKETYIFGDFNINLYRNDKQVFEKYWTKFRILCHMVYKNTSNFFGLKQLTSCLTRTFYNH